MAQESGTIILHGRELAWQRVDDGRYVGYTLTGKRGGSYVAIRLMQQPDTLRVVSGRGRTAGNIYQDIVLTDVNGTLEVADRVFVK